MQRSLRNLGLVGRIAGEKLGAREQLRDDGGRIVVVDAGAGEAGELTVLRAQLFKKLPHLQLAHLLGQLIVAAETDLRGHLGVEFVERTDAHLGHHGLEVGVGMGEVLKAHPRPLPEGGGIDYFCHINNNCV